MFMKLNENLKCGHKLLLLYFISSKTSAKEVFKENYQINLIKKYEPPGFCLLIKGEQPLDILMFSGKNASYFDQLLLIMSFDFTS